MSQSPSHYPRELTKAALYLFQYYNTDLLDIPEARNGEEAVAFMDDTLLLAPSKSLTESNAEVKKMMVRQGGGLDWSASHHCNFAIGKFRFMGLTSKREKNPLGSSRTRPILCQVISLQGVKVPVVTICKFLGVMIDQELC